MTRLYHPEALFEGQVVALNEAQSHYLRNVLRAKVGFQFSFFNERDGEWSAVLETLTKGTASATLGSLVRQAVATPEVSLLFAPLKHDAMSFLMEKATELGVRHFHPVMTERCNVSRLNYDRLVSNVTEAAQQCERFDIPTIHPILSLGKALESWDPQIPLLACQERGDALPIRQELDLLKSNGAVGFLVGPEGGFSAQELSYLKSHPFIKAVSLGPRILRAETAALAILSCYQAFVGDWERSQDVT